MSNTFIIANSKIAAIERVIEKGFYPKRLIKRHTKIVWEFETETPNPWTNTRYPDADTHAVTKLFYHKQRAQHVTVFMSDEKECSYVIHGTKDATVCAENMTQGIKQVEILYYTKQLF